MEVVEVKDFQCHSDGEEVVLLDLDKVNNLDDPQEAEEVSTDSIDAENNDDMSTNQMEIVEISSDMSVNGQAVDTGSSDNTETAVVVGEELPGDVHNGEQSGTVTVQENNVSEVLNVETINDSVVIENGELDEKMELANNVEDSANGPENILNKTTQLKTKTDKLDESNNKDDEETAKKDDEPKPVRKEKVSITIPPHIAGRDVSSLTEEKLPRSGKRMLKPRFGVKVPYIHMTSQIVTQDEIAKELFERFQQKYPMTRVDKPDKLFSMKLTHRLANKISPLKTPDEKSKETNKKSNNDLKNVNNIKKEQTKKKLDKPAEVTKIGENDLSGVQIIEVSEDTPKAATQINNSQHIDLITNTLKRLEQSEESNVTEDKNDGKISSNEELIAILEDFETIETADTNGNKVPESKPIVKCPVKRKIVRNNARAKRSKPKLDPEIEKQIALKQLEEVSRPKRFDSHFIKRKTETDKKVLVKNDVGSAQKRKKPTDDVPEVKIAIDQYIKSYTDKRQSVKAEPEENDEIQLENSDNVEKEDTKTLSNNVAKARTMREINRLLGDEGAINMIYSLEKRRTQGNNNSKDVLPSTRRKKKDLMLKTKLVKNAMLKMSSPNSSSTSNSRLGRRSDVTPTVSPVEKCSRKISVDSQGSDQSIKCLTNFSGRKIIPADESKIIRKHSSSSEASSIGGSPLLPVPDAIPINPISSTPAPVKTLRVYTRKNKNSLDSFTADHSLITLPDVHNGPNKIFAKTKNSNLKVKKEPSTPTTVKSSKSLTASIKQEVENTKYSEITIRRYDGVVHITLTPVSTVMKNALNISVMEELMSELHILEKEDSCNVVLISSAGRIFCQGLDIAPLINNNQIGCQNTAIEIASTIKKFITCLSNFPKLLVAGVDGAAVGLGATMLAHFDLVFASDKATFEAPYAQLGHIAEGAATTILSRLLVAEMIMGSQRLTAGQAHYYGLVTRTLWPDRFHDELVPLVKALARQSSQAIQMTKALQKQETKDKLAKALESETLIIVQQWISEECQNSLQRYLKDAVDNLNA
ncbi:chromodomain Y-like protein [Adelges cooleyi]|uniref:chromodomain Y-like protein n=1 Tax=Adelges cooleyi TaxID=133065 RepID=UPI00217F47F7|nr:chromodomain Y-like protein [Adelges cooleyi]